MSRTFVLYSTQVHRFLTYHPLHAAQILKLKTQSEHSVNIKVFGGKHSTKKLSKVRFCVKGRDNVNVYISAFVSDICEPLNSKFVNIAVQNYPHLEGFHFNWLI